MLQLSTTPKAKRIIRGTAGVILILFVLAAVVLNQLLIDSRKTFENKLNFEHTAINTQPFPLGVDPATESITESGNVEAYLQVHFARDYERTNRVTWVRKIYDHLATLPWYQSLASPNSRILVIYPGDRKEEISHNFGRILGWSLAEREEFLSLAATLPDTIAEGTLFPGRYVVTADAEPAEVAGQVQSAFFENVLSRYTPDIHEVVPLEEALIIASLIEREASSFSDMQMISGVIWRRLFSDMKLQLDATLQYARGSRAYEPRWWPVPVPNDKYINSEHNTYKHSGLPPSAIANPSAAAIVATLNPKDSDCLFYFHDDDGVMHCSANYEEHVSRLKGIYGRGR